MHEAKDLKETILRLYHSQEASPEMRKSGYLRATRLIAMMEGHYGFVPRYEEIVNTDNFTLIFTYDPKGCDIGISKDKLDDTYLNACYLNANQQDFWNNIKADEYIYAN